MLKAKISALGCYTPAGVLTNQDLEKMVQTNDQWIVDRTGIRQRHIAAPDEATSDMAAKAGAEAIAARGIEPAEIDVVIVCTVTPDMFFPATACLVQDKLGIPKSMGFRSGGRLLRLRLRPHHSRQPGHGRHAPPGARHRGRHDVPHHRL